MNCFLGIDTSNYTTSCALCDTSGQIIAQKKLLLPVKPGEKGLRQADALFHHTVALPALLDSLLCDAGHPTVCGVGVSERPRPVMGSYMPCFLAGVNAASAVASVLGLPLVRLSHQEGHIAAAAYSARLDLAKEQSFYALHLSGGTTELVQVDVQDEGSFAITLLGGTEDLSAGQAIDRIALMLGLPFPGGAALEALALDAGKPISAVRGLKVSVNGISCHFSGLENLAKKQLESGAPPKDIALYTFAFVQKTLLRLIANACALHGEKPVLFAGGVMSSVIMRQALGAAFDAYFSDGMYASDNAAGIALLTKRRCDAMRKKEIK